MRAPFALLLLAALAGCAFNEHPTLRDAGVCGEPGAECCEPDGGLRGPTPGVLPWGCQPGLYCRAGTCAACGRGTQACDNRCVPLASRDHCGACGNACAAGFDCVVGDGGAPRCERVCPAGQVRCGGGPLAVCATLARDPRHCGACYADCEARGLPNTASVACAGGACAVGACAEGFANCDMAAGNGCEVDTRSTPAHCGGCGRACPAPARATPTCTDGACGFACAEGYADCDRNPTNGCETALASDVSHCGVCDNRCPAPPGTTATCVRGVCGTRVGVCPSGRGDCDGDPSNGCETTLTDTLAHCGACGRACARANASASCLAGTCVLGACDTGFASCDGDPTNGCETALATSTTHCGQCGAFCAYANGRPACVGGACALASCNTGFGDCDGDPANGCEVDTRSTPAHCGACGRACDAGQRCANGACVTSCPSGQTACGGACVTVASDPANCGACGTSCAGRFANTVPACVGGSCVLGSCVGGYANCDGSASNGCEVNLNTSATNCGTCGSACDLPNATASCAAGRCVLGACNPGFADCDGDPANGCEANLNASTAHCARCANACSAQAPALPLCVAGACATGLGNCPAGTADCDGMVGNGCETNVASGIASCGGCGRVCSLANATERCEAGACVLVSCASGWGNCDGDPRNGCETSTRTSPAHCGGCNRACTYANAYGACSFGSCSLAACVTGFANCDGVTSNGCEANLQNSSQHCGACGRGCASGQVCRDGACR